MGWTLGHFLNNTVSRRRQLSRPVGSSFALLISRWTICGPVSPQWRTLSKDLKASLSNLLSAITRPTRPLPRSANDSHALRNKLKPIMNLFVPNSSRRADAKRLATIFALSALVIICGAGCFSMSNIKELDFGITGLEAEFYEPANTSTNKADGWFK